MEARVRNLKCIPSGIIYVFAFEYLQIIFLEMGKLVLSISNGSVVYLHVTMTLLQRGKKVNFPNHVLLEKLPVYLKHMEDMAN